jgi:outer membrane protein TolC
LNYLCGITDTVTFPLSDPNLAIDSLPQLQKSIFYQRFIIDSLKLINADQQIDFSYKPKLSLYGDAGYNSSFLYQPGKNAGASVGLNLNIPLYDGGQRKMQHNKNLIAEQTRKSYRSFYVNQYQQQINQLLHQLQVNQKVTEQINKQITYAQTLIDANRKLFETGDIHITDYILVISNFLTAKNMLVQNNVEKYRIINQINYWSRTN